MTLQEHVDACIALIKRNPGAGDLTIIHASDDEGNDYHEVISEPTLCIAEQPYYDNPVIFQQKHSERKNWNAVCIN